MKTERKQSLQTFPNAQRFQAVHERYRCSDSSLTMHPPLLQDQDIDIATEDESQQHSGTVLIQYTPVGAGPSRDLKIPLTCPLSKTPMLHYKSLHSDTYPERCNLGGLFFSGSVLVQAQRSHLVWKVDVLLGRKETEFGYRT